MYSWFFSVVLWTTDSFPPVKGCQLLWHPASPKLWRLVARALEMPCSDVTTHHLQPRREWWLPCCSSAGVADSWEFIESLKAAGEKWKQGGGKQEGDKGSEEEGGTADKWGKVEAWKRGILKLRSGWSEMEAKRRRGEAERPLISNLWVLCTMGRGRISGLSWRLGFYLYSSTCLLVFSRLLLFSIMSHSITTWENPLPQLPKERRCDSDMPHF